MLYIHNGIVVIELIRIGLKHSLINKVKRINRLNESIKREGYLSGISVLV